MITFEAGLFDQGWDAAKNGFKLSENPCNTDISKKIWIEGWNAYQVFSAKLKDIKVKNESKLQENN